MANKKNYQRRRFLKDASMAAMAFRSSHERLLLNAPAAGALDFDDILFFANRLFEQRKEVLEKYQERFLHVMRALPWLDQSGQ